MQPQFAIVMPVYNEEACIAPVVASWFKAVASIDGLAADRVLLIAVNDGSKDKTGAILDDLARAESRLKVVHQANGGHGAAVRRAYEEAVKTGAEWVFQVDSDDQFDPDDLRKLWAARAGSRLVLGRRLHRHDPWPRLVITRVLRALIALAFGRYLVDANIPFRLFRGDYLRSLLERLPPNVFAPNIFLSVIAVRDGERLQSIPVTHRERETGTVSILRWRLWKACFRCVREIVAFRLAPPPALTSRVRGVS